MKALIIYALVLFGLATLSKCAKNESLPVAEGVKSNKIAQSSLVTKNKPWHQRIKIDFDQAIDELNTLEAIQQNIFSRPVIDVPVMWRSGR